METNIDASSETIVSKLRKIFWPIEIVELKKFLPMAFMMFCVLFNYSCLRGLKDSLVVSGIGAEAIPFVKLWVVTPSAVLFTLLYMSLLNKFGDENVFYLITGIFVAFFAAFAYFLYPNEHVIHPDHEYIKQLAGEYPRIKWFILIYGKWLYITMYVFAELWGSIMLSLLFWQFANKITTSQEAKRFYSMFGLIGNVGLIWAGSVMKHFSKAPEGANLADHSIHMVANVLGIVIVLSITLGLIYKWMNVVVLPDSRYYTPVEKVKSGKAKLSIKDSLNLILTSKYLGMIAMLVLAYGVSINLVEVSWKAKVRELYPSKEAFLHFFGNFIQQTGAAAIVFFLLGSNILRLFTWKVAASITPAVILVTGLGFFAFSIFQNELSEYTNYIGYSSLVIAVFLGAMQNVLSKSIKYSLFDATKEMAYIPIDPELKSKGKAAVDIIGGRMGKSGGAMVQFLLISAFPLLPYVELLPYIMVVFVIILALWFVAIGNLNKEYTKFVQEK